MGQRSQIFLSVNNPVKAIKTKQKNYNVDFLSTKQKRMLGSKDTTILPFYDQWCFGGGLVQKAINILSHTSEIKKNPTNINTPFTNDGICDMLSWKLTFKEYIERVSFILNYQQKENNFTSCGFGNSIYFGENDKKFNEDYTSMDNNDGILIIDTINNKYCFMNIGPHYDNELSNGIYDIEQLVPISAKTYIEAYYPIKAEKLSKYRKEMLEDKPNGIEEYITKNILRNHKLIKQLEDFSVLTPYEVNQLFPKMVKIK